MEQQKSETKTKKKFNLAALFCATDTRGITGEKNRSLCHTYADWKYCTAAL